MRPRSSIAVLAALSLAATTLCAGLIAHETDEVVSHIRRQPVESHAIAAVGYSQQLHALEIEFRNGAIYRYLDVPGERFRDLLAAESKARFYDRNIRGKYRSRHVKRRRK